MTRLKEFIRQHNKVLLIAVIIGAILLVWKFINSFSETTTSSAWDGVVAKEFTSGTGTIENPYVIASASEFAYFKNLMEGEDASVYANKNYRITNSFNYGEYDLAINNEIPFAGTIDGFGNTIYNANVTNAIFNALDGAAIKNIGFSDMNYALENETGAILATTISDSEISMVVFSGDVSVNKESSFGGIAYTSTDSEYENIVLNYEITTESENIYKFAYTLVGDIGTNILINNDEYDNTSSKTDIVFSSFSVSNEDIVIANNQTLDDYKNDDYEIVIVDHEFVIRSKEIAPEEKSDIDKPSTNNTKGAKRGIIANDTITEHVSGVSGTTVYVNDFVSDKNYLTGLNYAEIRNTSIPSGTSTGYYDDEYLVKVEIIYDGQDINNSSLVGAVSPLNENANKFIYYKYYALERTSSGALATNDDGDNYIRIELIDNPFSKRPYTGSGNNIVEYGFNGWVCNQNVDTTANLCDNSIMRFNKADYTRYMDVAVAGGSEIIIHLNATWHEADVVTSYYDLSSFKNMSMQPTFTTSYRTVQRRVNAFWKQNYTQMVYTRSYTYNNGYLPAGIWYRTNRNSGTYIYVASSNSVRPRQGGLFFAGETYYAFTADTSGIVGGTQYTGGSYTFVANFNSTGNNTDTTIYTYNETYMDFVDDPNGTYTYNEQVPVYNSGISAGMNVSGYYFKVSNPTETMIATGEYYDDDGVLCTSTSACATAYKLIQYNDAMQNSNNNSIYLTESLNGGIVDAGNYYYLVTRDLNIFRYTNNTGNGLTMYNLQSNRPFTVTGTAVNGTTATGLINISGTTFTASNDIVIENIRMRGPNTNLSNTNNMDLDLGGDSKTSSVIYANSHNLKIGRNVTPSRGASYLMAESIFGGTNTAVSGTFRVIVESGIYYSYHSGIMSTNSSSNVTLNETTILGSDYDRVSPNNTKLRFTIGLDGYAGGYHTAGSDSLFASFTYVKSGQLGYNYDGTANSDNTAGMYIGGRASPCVNSITGAKIEGGQVNMVVGGYGYNGTETTNSTYIGMSGGSARSIYGGAGHSTSKGNRIINVTGGTVSYSVLGGSDSYNSGSTDDGIIQGSTLVYVGGNATVGGGSGMLLGVEAGSVFGAGGGDTSSDQKGTVYNSHVIINGGTINTSVYGGGNYGSTGTQSSSAASTVIDIYAGTIGDVYGGSKSAGFSKSNFASTSTIDINIAGGTITNVYGGSNTEGNINGSVDIEVTGGTVSGNVYGGGKGEPTVVTNDVTVTIGASSAGPSIGGNVYGGSAFGTVNSQSDGTVTVTVNNGTITGSVFGGGEGSTSITARVLGDTTVNVTGGNISYVYGGSDTSGVSLKDVSVNVTGGTISHNVYGGGKGANTFVVGDVDVTIGTANVANKPTISGSVYGGSAFGTVNANTATGPATGNTTVTVHNGTVTNSVYGGGEGSSTITAHVLGDTTVSVTGGNISYVYGGSDTSGVSSGDVGVSVTGGTISHNVYGGGKGANTFVVGDVDVTIGTANVANKPTISGSVYGGSAFGTVNASTTSGPATGDTTVTVNNGIVTGSVFGGGQGDANNTPYVLGDITVTINDGDITSVFGGNDQAGSHTANNEVHLNGGIIESVYGGGNRSSVTNTNVYMNGATVTNIYGGSNTLGDVSTTNVDITSGTVQNVYGGNNEGGTCGTTDVNVTGTATINGSIYGGGNQVNTTTTNVTLNSATGTVPNVYGGGNSASVTTSNVTNNGITATNIFGGSNSTGTVTTANITYNSGSTTNVYGGNNAGGNTVTSNIDVISGTITTLYGGGNQANGGTSDIDITGGAVTTIFGGGNSAGLTSSDIYINGGTHGEVYGGSNSSGTLPTTNITVDNATSITAIYGGGNRAQVGSPTVTVNGGVIGNIYGGGNLAQVTGNTTVDINGGTINNNVYGGGNFGVVKGSSEVTITNATVLGSAYAGGNGSSATLEGSTNITIDGNTVIGTPSSVPPASGSVFGGGNQAYTGVEANNNSTSHVNIVGGTFYGNIYGGANTSVIYGNTIVNIGENAITSNDLVRSNIYIKGHIFGGGEANASGSEIYDWHFISVTQGVNINIDAANYNSFQIDGSFYGGGNASTASGDSYLLIRNYGTVNNPKRNISIQRVTYATLDNSSIILAGAIDRANEYNTELFAISRVDDLKIKNNSTIYFVTGANLLKKFESLDSSDNYATVTIDEENNTVSRTVNNRIYMYEGRNLNIAKDQQNSDYGEVKGMTFFGLFNLDGNNNINTGIYNNTYAAGDTLDWGGVFDRGGYVIGKHVANHNIKVDGFYTNYINKDTSINEVNYIQPTPDVGQFYMWYVGESFVEYNVNLTASKYSTLGSYELTFPEYSRPNTSFQILGFDSSEIAAGIALIDKNNIPRIANSTDDANTKFGLAMEAGNSGWLTTGKTSFYTGTPAMGGLTYYEGENSTAVPSMLFYLYHSKNLTETQDLGTVRILVRTITKINPIKNDVDTIVIKVHMTSALFQTLEYEGSMTPGDKYELFTSTATNITNKSKFSTYYGLYAASKNAYKPGYHRALTSSYILPENTKITMIDFANGSTEYYYHVITATDVVNATAEFQSENECSYDLSLFTRMGSINSNSNYDDAAKNAIYYDGTDSSEEFIFIVDFGDTNIQSDQLGKQLLIEMRDGDDEVIISVLGQQLDQLKYNIYTDNDSTIDEAVTASLNPLYIGYNDIFEVNVDYQSSTLSGTAITDTQYFDYKLGVQISIKNAEGNLVSGTDLTGAYFEMDGIRYYPDIAGYTHIKLVDKVGNTKKWITFNTENAGLATGSYTFTFEAFASPDGIYYSSGRPDIVSLPLTIINSTYGLNPVIDDETVIFSGTNNDKSLRVTTNYTSLLTNPNIRIAMYRREYDEVYETDYVLVDFQDYVSGDLTETNIEYVYLLTNNPQAVNTNVIGLNSSLLTGTYRLSFMLYDGNTMIGEINRYIVIK